MAKLCQPRICIIGAGLAGSECALALARQGIKVELFDTKPNIMSSAHHSSNFAEIVCSNSFKNNSPLSASGLLKSELTILNCELLKIANECSVPAGGALAVDRNLFSEIVTNKILNNKNIILHSNCNIIKPFKNAINVFSVGPLPYVGLENKLNEILGKNVLKFYDASAPIVLADSVDMNKAYWGGRYGKDLDYLNCPMTKEQYEVFVDELLKAEKVILKDFEKQDVFDGCMPIEVLASRGKDSLRFGPLKPKGLPDPNSGREPFAVVQLRKENLEADSYGLVGFQTNLKFGEQKRVFSLIPALKNAEFIKYGVMHRNTFIDAPQVFDKYFKLKQNKDIYFAGQISGVEGYVESIASGLIVAMEIFNRIKGGQNFQFDCKTMIGSLCEYVHSPNSKFMPMNANYGIMCDIHTQNMPKKLTKETKAKLRYDESQMIINKLKEDLKWR